MAKDIEDFLSSWYLPHGLLLRTNANAQVEGPSTRQAGRPRQPLSPASSRGISSVDPSNYYKEAKRSHAS